MREQEEADYYKLQDIEKLSDVTGSVVFDGQ